MPRELYIFLHKLWFSNPYCTLEQDFMQMPSWLRNQSGPFFQVFRWGFFFSGLFATVGWKIQIINPWLALVPLQHDYYYLEKDIRFLPSTSKEDGSPGLREENVRNTASVVTIKLLFSLVLEQSLSLKSIWNDAKQSFPCSIADILNHVFWVDFVMFHEHRMPAWYDRGNSGDCMT